MTPPQALQLLAQVVAQTRALPHEVDAMRQALDVLDRAISDGPTAAANGAELVGGHAYPRPDAAS